MGPVMRCRTVSAAAAAVVLLTTLPAHASSQSVQDRRGDAPPVNDITRVAYDNEGKRFKIKITAPEVDLSPRTWWVVTFADPTVDNKTLEASVSVKRNGTLKLEFYYFEWIEFPDRSVREDLPCPGLRGRVQPQRSLVKLKVPKSCLRDVTRLDLPAGKIRIRTGSFQRRMTTVDSTKAVRMGWGD